MPNSFNLITTIAVIFITSFIQSANGQSTSERYLRYERSGRAVLNELTKQPQIDTSFKLVDMVYKSGSKWFRKGMSMKSSWRKEIEVKGKKIKSLSFSSQSYPFRELCEIEIKSLSLVAESPLRDSA